MNGFFFRSKLNILIESSWFNKIYFPSRLSNVTLETAIFISGAKNNLAIGVEMCECPSMYEGSSCQNPADGYYRYREIATDTSHLHYEHYIGKSVSCECNYRSSRCDKETGHCEVEAIFKIKWYFLFFLLAC